MSPLNAIVGFSELLNDPDLNDENRREFVGLIGDNSKVEELSNWLGAGLAWLAFDGFTAATLNFTSFSQVTFAFEVSPSLLVLGTVFAMLIGFVGGLFPAIRAARLPIATALREQ